MPEKLSFLTSTRFWALVIGGLSIASEGGFTPEAWMKGILFVVTGFTAVRTADKFKPQPVA